MLEPIQASFIVQPFKILEVGRENFTVFEFFVDIFGNTSTWSTHPLVSFVNFPKSCCKILLLLFNTPFWPFFRRTIIRKWLSSHYLFSIFKNGFAAICASQSNFVSAPSRPKTTVFVLLKQLRLPGFSLCRRLFFYI